MNTIPSFHSNQFQIMGGHKITHTNTKHANACMTRFTEQDTYFILSFSSLKVMTKEILQYRNNRLYKDFTNALTEILQHYQD